MVQQNKDMKVLKSIWKRAMKMGKGLENKIYEEWLMSLGLFSPDKRMKLMGALMAAYSSSQGETQNSLGWKGPQKKKIGRATNH